MGCEPSQSSRAGAPGQVDPTEKAPFFSLIVPVLNGGPSFRLCLQSIADSSFQDWQLIVADDGSTDGSIESAEQDGAVVVRTPGQVGPAAARNQGAAEATGYYLFFTDADCSLHSMTLERAAMVLIEDPTIDAIFGSYDDEPAAPGVVSRFKNLQHHFVHQRASPATVSFWAGCGAVRRSAFEAVGGFDGMRFDRPSIEDIDLGYRLDQAGYKIRLIKDLQVKHHKAWTLRSLVKSDVIDRGIPWTVLLAERRVRARELNLSWRGRLSAITGLLALVSLVLALWWPPTLGVAGALLLTMLLLNWDFYRFLYRRGGMVLCLGGLFLHWLYQLDCFVAFALGTVAHWIGQLGRSA